MELIDTHAHLGWNKFDQDRDQVVENAKDAGVTRIISIGTDIEKSKIAIQQAEQYPEVYAAIGIHPTDVCEIETEDWVNELKEISGHAKVVAIGETGLDHFHSAPEGCTEKEYHTQQIECFEKQLELAIQLDLPVIVHQRNSFERIMEVLKPYHGKVRTVFHCWNQSTKDALNLIENNHRVSFTGIVTFKNAKDVQETVSVLPSGSFFLETDSPFLAPDPHRGKRCEPAHTKIIAEKIAQLRGVTLEQITEETTTAANEFFFQ